MVVAGFLVKVEPGGARQVANELRALAGVEVHPAPESNNLAVVVEAEASEELESLAIGRFASTHGVLGVYLTYVCLE